MWFVLALASSVFAALTSILAKIGIEGVGSHLATAIRTLVVVVMSWGMVFLTNQQGGIMGGRTYGKPVCFTVAMRPTPTVFVEQDSVDLATMKPAKLSMKGRHDPCIVRRAVPVVEAVTAFAVMDALLAAEAERPKICLTLTGETLEEDIEQYRSQRYFTDMVELRVDLLKKSARAQVAKFPAMLAKEADEA
jgi:chorismate synthase